MRRLALQVLAVVFALSVSGLVVANAAATSGCSRADPIAKDPRPAASSVNAAALPTPSASGVASAGAVASTSLPAAPSAAQVPIENAPYLGGTKSGMVFRPKPNAAPSAAKGSTP